MPALMLKDNELPAVVAGAAPIPSLPAPDDGSIKPVDTASVVNSLSLHINGLWDEAKRERQASGMDQKLVDCDRQYKGEYDERTLAAIKELGGFDGFRKITMGKANAALAWLMDGMLDEKNKGWKLVPGAEPKLSGGETARIQAEVDGVVQSEMAGAVQGLAPVDQMELERIQHEMVEAGLRMTRDKILDEAKRRAASMEELMDSQLENGGWDAALEDFLMDFVVFPNAFLKGPYLTVKRVVEWKTGLDGRVSPEAVDKLVVSFARVSPFDVFPGPRSRGVDDSYLFERIYLTRCQLNDLKLITDPDTGRPVYKAEAIDKVLSSPSPTGNGQFFVGQVDIPKQQLEQRTPTTVYSSTYNLFEGAVFYGAVPGRMLKEWGMPVDDEFKDHEVTAVIVNGEVIKAVFNEDPLRRRPISTCSFKRLPGAFWGIALPDVMSDIQRQMNAVTRALCNNLALGSGPQVVVDTSLLLGSEKLTSVVPYKIWQQDGSKAMNGRKFMEVVEIPCHVQELLYAYSQFKGEADEVTEIPAFFQGAAKIGGAGDTASGLSMLQENAQKGVRRMVMNITSKVLLTVLRRLYDYNMMYAADDSVKGDAEIVLLGPLNVDTNESLQNKRMNFLAQSGGNPVDAQIIGAPERATIWRAVAKDLDLPVDEVVPSAEDVRKRMQPPPAPMPPMAPGEPPRGGADAPAE
jgi:hypothetical protein